MTTILVTGGAGYVGSVSVEAFLAAGHDVVVLDDLTTGHRGAVPPAPRSTQGPYADQDAVGRLLETEGDRRDPPLRGALAGRRIDPRPGQVLPRQRRRGRGPARGGPHQRASSGSCSPRPRPSTASRTRRPSPRTRRSADQPVRRDQAHASRARCAWYGAAYGLRSVTLRYFNVAGATEALGEDHDPETHLIPSVLAAAEGAPS